MQKTTKNPQDCAHVWRPAGLWDGKTPEGKRTGGVMYKCIKCGEKAFTKEEVYQKGGMLEEENYNIYGQPIAKKSPSS